jgi:hypothetical protein
VPSAGEANAVLGRSRTRHGSIRAFTDAEIS